MAAPEVGPKTKSEFKHKFAFRNRNLLVLDVLIITAAYLITYFLASANWTSTFHMFIRPISLVTMGVSVVILIVSMYFAGIYRTMWVHSGTYDYIRIIQVCAVASLVVVAIDVMFIKNVTVKICICALALSSAGILFMRMLCRATYNLYRGSKIDIKDRKRLMIVGAGTSAAIFMKDLYSNENLNYNIVCFVDDDDKKKNAIIGGVKVCGNRYDIPRLAKMYDVDEILIAMPSASPNERKKIIEICNETSCKVKILPSVDQMIGNGMHSTMRDVQIEDLLAREPIKLNNTEIESYIKDKVILVTGGGGSIGSELCRQIMKYSPKKLVIVDIYENNAYDLQMELNYAYPDNKPEVIIASVRERERMENIFATYKPFIVFHAAAHKHVPLMEDSPQEAIKNNVMGTRNLVLCADKYNVKRFVMISTDKAVNPTNVMGATKRICEMIVQTMQKSSKTEFVAVRFGNVLGSNGSVIPLFKRQIEKGGPVTLTDKRITRYFMTIPEASQLVLQSAAYAKGGEIFVLDMGEPVKIYDLAKNLIRLSGYKPDEDIKIEICGLRPGEKLYEELLMDEEGLTNTSHDKIFVGKPIDIEREELAGYLQELEDAVKTNDNEKIKATIEKVVPTYHRNKN